MKLILVNDNSTCREIRSLDVAHQTLDTDRIILHICLDRIRHFSQVMRRDAGRHTYRDSFGTIHQDIRNFDWKNRRFFLRLIKVRHKVDNILVKIPKKNFLCQFLQAGFRITHGCSTISLDGAEISMSVHQSPALFEVLCHNDQSIVNGTVPVRMIFTHCISDNTGTFTIWAVIADPQFIHII